MFINKVKYNGLEATLKTKTLKRLLEESQLPYFWDKKDNHVYVVGPTIILDLEVTQIW